VNAIAHAGGHATNSWPLGRSGAETYHNTRRALRLLTAILGRRPGSLLEPKETDLSGLFAFLSGRYIEREN
jgi:hypothetical protein